MTAYRLLRAVSVLAAVATGVLPAVPAHAAPGDEFRWSVRPSDAKGSGSRSQFAYDLSPGQKINDHVTVRNVSSTPLTFSIYPADAYTTTDGAFALPIAGSKPRDGGTWITLKPVRRTVKPGQQIVLPFDVAVPRNATPGDHAAGIIAAVSVPTTDASGQQVVVDRRVAARMYVRVAGALNPQVQVEAVTARFDNPLIPGGRGPMTVTYSVRNTGNVRLTGTAAIHAVGLFGIPISGKISRQLPEMLPGARVELTDRIDGAFGAGKLTAIVDVTTKADAATFPAATGTSVLWRVPWTLVYLLVVAAAVVAVWRLRRRRRIVPPMQAQPVPVSA